MFPFEGELNSLLLHVTHNIIYLHEPGDSKSVFEGPFQLDLRFYILSLFWTVFVDMHFRKPVWPIHTAL